VAASIVHWFGHRDLLPTTYNQNQTGSNTINLQVSALALICWIFESGIEICPLTGILENTIKSEI